MHKKSCKPYKRAIRTRLQNVTSNKETATEPAGEPADLGEMLVDNVRVRFLGQKNYIGI